MPRRDNNHKNFGPTVTLLQKSLDNLPQGFLKVDIAGNITYADATFCQIAGIPGWEGRSVRQLVSDPDTLGTLLRRLARRFTLGIGEEYEIEITRASDGKRVPVLVTAIPEADRDGQVIGSLALIRDLSMPKVTQAIHKHIEKECDAIKLLTLVAEETRKVVPFDWLTITFYTPDLEYCCVLFDYPPEKRPAWRVRWFPTPPIVLRFLEKKAPICIPDLEQWLEQPDWRDLKSDSTTQEFLALGYRSSIWRPVVRGDQIVAGIGLYRGASGVYSKTHFERLLELPLRQAVSMALYYVDRKSYEFRLRLINRISREPRSVTDIGKIIVDEVAKQYKWNNVSVFRVDEHRKKLVLLWQSVGSPEFRLDSDYVQDLAAGVLGHVYRTGKPLNIGNVRKPPFSEIFIRAYPTVSELCIPIMRDRKVVGILNVEDSAENAFVQEDSEALTAILDELGAAFERLRAQMTLEAILQCAGDVIIVTDDDGLITRVNPATEKVLGYEATELLDTSLGRYVADAYLAEPLLQAEKLLSQEIRFVRRDGCERQFVLSAARLPRELGGTVYIGVDLSDRLSSERIELLGDLLHEIAMLSQTPLSIATGFLRSLIKSLSGREKETAEKALRQLGKVEVGFDRLMLFEREGNVLPYYEVLLDVPEVLREVLSELPRHEAQLVSISTTDQIPTVRGDLFQLSFSIKSVLSFLIPFATDEDPIRISIGREELNVAMAIAGRAPEITGREARAYADERWIAETVMHMRLGEDTLRAMIEDNMGGRWHRHRRIGEDLEFRLTLPAVKGEFN